MACSDGLPTPQNLVQWDLQDPTDGATLVITIFQPEK